MEGLKTLIRNLAFILLLATFLEMLLPSKSMRGLVQLVMGLFVIAAVLNPLADFMSWDFTDKIPAWTEISSTDLPVLASDGKQADSGKSAVREQYKKILVNQIQALVGAVDGVAASEINVDLAKDTGGFSDYPKILKINILYSLKTGATNAITPVAPVIIGGDSNKKNSVSYSDKAQQIKKQVSSLMQIPEEVITVQEKY
ncbi:MAG: stage III sporulation protein AF [Peptococcaceae bacterium]|nr:stage III sporulation protein AF [Peptococcaceae bacterium]